MTTTTTQDLAREAAQHFETRTRSNGDHYVTSADNAPEWVLVLIYGAHGDFLPEDWRYEKIRDALEAIADHDGEPMDAEFDFRDGAVDAYSFDRLRWLSSDLNRPGYCDEAAEDVGLDDADLMTRIGWGQDMEAGEIFALVVQALERRADDLA